MNSLFGEQDVIIDTSEGSIKGRLLSHVYLEGPHHTPELLILRTCKGPTLIVRDFIVIKEPK